MKIKILPFFLFFCLTLKAQVNLVPNPSFESYDTCPNTASQIRYAFPWFQPTLGTPDYLNGCALISSEFSVPQNLLGYQNARTGFGYAGFYLYYYTNNQTTYREYIESPLNDSLVAGRRYYLRLYLSFSDSSRTATDAFGVCFSHDSILTTNWNEISITPQIQNISGNYLIDRVNWMSLSGDFIAQGGEKFITIGNFRNYINTDSIFISGGGLQTQPEYKNGYYYIDDICVSDDSLFCYSSVSVGGKIPHQDFSIFPNPSKGNLHIYDNNITKHPLYYHLLIYNSAGRIVSENFVSEGDFQINYLKSGLYLFKIITERETVNKKIIIYH